jgi:hypothetical protein
MNCLEFVNYDNKLYTVYRKLKDGRVKEEHFNEIREFWGCDLVLKSKVQDGTTTILFLREITDATLVN